MKGDGYSFWFTPKSTVGRRRTVPLRSLHAERPTSMIATRDRTIVGVAYWFKHQGTVSTAIMLDYEEANFDKLVPPLAKTTKIALHGLVNF